MTTISDFYSARQWHSSGMYADYFRPWGVDHELRRACRCIRARPGAGQTLRLMFTRGPGPDFSERDRSLLALLRPHLHQAYLDTQRRRDDKPELTHRQRELMVLVAAGQTNIQIARQLGLSEGTVRKHLENIYTRLHVSSRTAAVIRTFPTTPPSSRNPQRRPAGADETRHMVSKIGESSGGSRSPQ